MIVAMAIWQDGASINELGRMSSHSGAEEEPMRLAALVTATALGLGGLATAYLYHDQSDPRRRYGSWQELSAAQPSCRSMTNLSELNPENVGGLQCSVPGVACARHDWMCADLN
jgi:hypothetical protein